MNIVNYIGMENMRKDLPLFKAGDTLRVHWIDARGMEDLVQATRAIAEHFEIALSEILR